MVSLASALFKVRPLEGAFDILAIRANFQGAYDVSLRR